MDEAHREVPHDEAEELRVLAQRPSDPLVLGSTYDEGLNPVLQHPDNLGGIGLRAVEEEVGLSPEPLLSEIDGGPKLGPEFYATGRFIVSRGVGTTRSIRHESMELEGFHQARPLRALLL